MKWALYLWFAIVLTGLGANALTINGYYFADIFTATAIVLYLSAKRKLKVRAIIYTILCVGALSVLSLLFDLSDFRIIISEAKALILIASGFSVGRYFLEKRSSEFYNIILFSAFFYPIGSALVQYLTPEQGISKSIINLYLIVLAILVSFLSNASWWVRPSLLLAWTPMSVLSFYRTSIVVVLYLYFTEVASAIRKSLLSTSIRSIALIVLLTCLAATSVSIGYDYLKNTPVGVGQILHKLEGVNTDSDMVRIEAVMQVIQLEYLVPSALGVGTNFDTVKFGLNNLDSTVLYMFRRLGLVAAFILLYVVACIIKSRHRLILLVLPFLFYVNAYFLVSGAQALCLGMILSIFITFKTTSPTSRWKQL